MAEQHYRCPSSPNRAKRGYSDASTSLSPFGGPAPGSALEQRPQVLGMTGLTSIPYDHTSVPRTFRPLNGPSFRASNNPRNPGLYPDGCPDGQQPTLEDLAILWPTNYSLQSRNTNRSVSSATPIDLFQRDPEPSWTSLRVVPPPGPNSDPAHTQQRLGQHSSPNKGFLAGPGSDLVSRTNETDEGYYTTSQPDLHSVQSINTSNMNQERHDSQHSQMMTSSPYHRPRQGSATLEQPGSDILHDQTNANHAVQLPQRPASLACEHEGCKTKSTTPSEFKKHAARHTKKFVCKAPGCQRPDGFATINDLERHQKCVHKMRPEHGQTKDYKCFGASCSKHEKIWPRLDNFKHHLGRMHSNENEEMLIRRSNEWYEQHTTPEPKPEICAPPRVSTSSSHQASTHGECHMGDFPIPGPWVRRGTSNQGRPAGPGPSYAHSEFGNYSTGGNGGSPSQALGQSSTRRVQFQSNSAQCFVPGCSQTFTTVAQLGAHLRSRHGTQKGLDHYTGIQHLGPTWHNNQSNPGNQYTSSSGQQFQMQKSVSHAAGVPSQFRAQTRAVNGGYGPQTAPEPSIPAVRHRLEEDFDNRAMMQAQVIPLEAASSDILAGMMEQFQPDMSQTSNSGLDGLQEQLLCAQEDHHNKSDSSLSIETIKVFLQDKYPDQFPDHGVDHVASVVQGTLKSLQSMSSNADMSSIPVTASALDMDSCTPSIRNGEHGLLCTFPSCNSFWRRRCDFNKHYKRHTLPWACTFDMCHKPCGSKNDWRRHEHRLHEQQESWRCEEVQSNVSGRSVPSSGDDACKRLFSTKDLYQKHLEDQHEIREDGLIAELFESQRIGAKCKGQYWCGFCNKIILMKAIGLEGDSERYNHIDHHFMKDRYKIAHWKPLNGRPGPGDGASTIESTHSSPESIPSTSSPKEGDVDAAVSANLVQSVAAHNSFRKRPAPTPATGTQEPAAKVARSGGSRAHMVQMHMINCCQCPNSFQKWNAACMNCEHRVCPNCSVEVFQQTEQR